MRVTAIRFAADNYAYWVQRIGGTVGFLVDSGSAPELKSFFAAKGLPKLQHLFSTHKHMDHCGGNLGVISPTTKVYAGIEDAKEVPGCNAPLKDGDQLEIDGLTISALHVPCHTVGHMLYCVRANELANEKVGSVTVTKGEAGHWVEYSGGLNRVMFTGDTIFVGGCGRFFEGNASDMLKIMDRTSTLPEDLYLFCGHEYAFSDAKFGAQVEPGNPAMKELLERSAKSEAGEFILPSTLGDERRFNVFMRCRTKEVQAAVGSDDPLFCMNTLRTAKNKGSFVPKHGTSHTAK